jgi:transcriptional regulator with XRE-family HTH domain
MNLPLGDNIKKLRTEQQVTQEQLAEHLCISYQAVSKWENSLTIPDTALLPRIAEFFGVTIDALFKPNMTAYRNKEERLLSIYEDTRSTEDFNRADDAYQKLLASDSVSHHDVLARAILHGYRASDYITSATALYNKAIVLGALVKDHKYYQAQRQLINLLWRCNRNQENIERHTKLLEEEPDNVQNHLSLALAFYYDGDLDKAWHFIYAGLRVEPNNAFLLNFAGDICKKQKCYYKALDYWDKSSVADEALHGQSLVSKAFLYRELGVQDKAIRMFEELIDWLETRGLDVETQWPKRQIAEIRAEMP